jgi:hypothetical protein
MMCLGIQGLNNTQFLFYGFRLVITRREYQSFFKISNHRYRCHSHPRWTASWDLYAFKIRDENGGWMDGVSQGTSRKGAKGTSRIYPNTLVMKTNCFGPTAERRRWCTDICHNSLAIIVYIIILASRSHCCSRYYYKCVERVQIFSFWFVCRVLLPRQARHGSVRRRRGVCYYRTHKHTHTHAHTFTSRKLK